MLDTYRITKIVEKIGHYHCIIPRYMLVEFVETITEAFKNNKLSLELYATPINETDYGLRIRNKK